MPIINFGQPTNLDEIVAAIGTRLSETGVVRDVRSVFLSFHDPRNLTQEARFERFITLTPDLLNVQPRVDDGAGRKLMLFSGPMKIRDFVRIRTDQHRRDTAYIQDDDRGVAKRIFDIASALHDWYPLAPGDSSIFSEYGKVLSVRVRPRMLRSGFGFTELDYRITFCYRL